MRTLVLLWSVIALATAFNCYSMSTTGGDAPGSETKTAACSSHCYKTTAQSGNQTGLKVYGCDDGLSHFCTGISDGSCKMNSILGIETQICCCGSELCNSVGVAQPLALLTLLMAYFLY